MSTEDRKTVSVEIEGEMFDLLPERCAYRVKTKTLIAADLHWGKAEVFQKNGLALPSAVLDDDLRRLDRAIAKTGAKTLLILGDLIHAPAGVIPSVIETVSTWRKAHPDLRFQLIRGNHDRQHRWPDSWQIEDVGTGVKDGNLFFTHDELKEKRPEFVWAGHHHPVINLRGGGDSLRLPCFAIHLKQRRALLPAFSAFTGGAPLAKRSEQERVFAITETAVIEV